MKGKFYTQLEGYRGLAILLVLVSHFTIINYFPQLIFLNLGFWGVNLFFVLSGFLITEILLRDIYSGNDRGVILKKFYYRRVLRIFPVYYLVILVMGLFNVGNTRPLLPWTLSYTLNIAEIIGSGKNEIFMHIWSLCVEEQFYLLWPLLLVFSPARTHFKLILGIVLSAILLRIVGASLWGERALDFTHSSMFTCMDSLGLGALLAYFKVRKESVFNWIGRHAFWGWLFLLLFELLSYKFSAPTLSFQVWGRLLTSLSGFFLVAFCVRESNVLSGRFFAWSVTRYIGRISYGVYIYHWILYFLFRDEVTKWWLMLTGSGKLRYHPYIGVFLFFFILSITVATLSFYLFEKPILKMKNRLSFSSLVPNAER